MPSDARPIPTTNQNAPAPLFTSFIVLGAKIPISPGMPMPTPARHSSIAYQLNGLPSDDLFGFHVLPHYVDKDGERD